MRTALALVAFVLLAAPPAAAQPAGELPPIRSTAITVTPFHGAHTVRGDDGKDHVEYDLLVTNVFNGPVTITGVEVVDPAGAVLMHVEGEALAASMQTLLEGKPAPTIPASGAIALEVDLILPPGQVPPRVSHRIAYSFDAADPLASMVGVTTLSGPEVVIDTRPAIVIAAPLSGPGWAAINGCCTPNVHRNVRVAAETRIATPETFAIDWVRLEPDGSLFAGDGKSNDQYPYFGAPVTSVADGEVVATGDGMAETPPFQSPTTVKRPEDYGGNFVLVLIAPDVYAFYAHLQPGSITLKPGDQVTKGALIGRLGSTGNSTNPHLHFGLIDRPDFLTGNSLPFVIDSFTLTATITGGEGAKATLTPVSRTLSNAFPLVNGVATFR